MRAQPFLVGFEAEERRRSLSQFYTPPDLAARLWDWCHVLSRKHVPFRVLASDWHGVVAEVDVRGPVDHHGRRSDELGVLVRPTMRGQGWSTTPVWLPYERVRPAVEA